MMYFVYKNEPKYEFDPHRKSGKINRKNCSLTCNFRIVFKTLFAPTCVTFSSQLLDKKNETVSTIFALFSNIFNFCLMFFHLFFMRYDLAMPYLCGARCAFSLSLCCACYHFRDLRLLKCFALPTHSNQKHSSQAVNRPRINV